MADLGAVLEQLIQAPRRAEGELKQLDKVIEELSKPRGRFSGGKKRLFSAAARERIAAAQKGRWAKARALSNRPGH
jgi:hypothetical protein